MRKREYGRYTHKEKSFVNMYSYTNKFFREYSENSAILYLHNIYTNAPTRKYQLLSWYISKDGLEIQIYMIFSGNVWGWCWDWHDDNYHHTCQNQGSVINPTVPNTGTYKIIRGCCWVRMQYHEWVACRYKIIPSATANTIVPELCERLTKHFQGLL